MVRNSGCPSNVCIDLDGMSRLDSLLHKFYWAIQEIISRSSASLEVNSAHSDLKQPWVVTGANHTDWPWLNSSLGIHSHLGISEMWVSWSKINTSKTNRYERDEGFLLPPMTQTRVLHQRYMVRLPPHDGAKANGFSRIPLGIWNLKAFAYFCYLLTCVFTEKNWVVLLRFRPSCEWLIPRWPVKLVSVRRPLVLLLLWCML